MLFIELSIDLSTERSDVLRFGSVCSGIEAASLAWESLGLRPSWFAEVDPFCNAVLMHHWPLVPNLGDIEQEKFVEQTRRYEGIDILVGGSPCQPFSSAGKRKGFADPRGNLTLRFFQIAKEIKPTWLVWENVAGVLSQDGGRSFGTILGKVEELGYRWAYRVCNAEFFGVPQRRRRVFLVGYLGDRCRPEEVLFEQEGEGRNFAASQKEGSDVAGVAGESTATVIPIDMRQASRGDKMTNNRGDGVASGGEPGTVIGEVGDPSPTVGGSHTPVIAYQCHGSNVGPMGTLRRGNGNVTGGVPFIVNAAESCAKVSHTRATDVARCLDQTGGFAAGQGGTVVVDIYNQQISDVCPTLYSGQEGHSGAPYAAIVAEGDKLVVRRLTPLECERLQGLPDNHTLVPFGLRAKPAPDSRRYKAVGNSMAVPCVRWIGERLLWVDGGGTHV